MTTDIVRATATWPHREKTALIALLADALGRVPPYLLAEARLRAAEAAETEIERELSVLLDEYVRSSTLERAAIAQRAPNAATLRQQTAEIARRHRRQMARLDEARAELTRRRAEWWEARR